MGIFETVDMFAKRCIWLCLSDKNRILSTFSYGFKNFSEICFYGKKGSTYQSNTSIQGMAS